MKSLIVAISLVVFAVVVYQTNGLCNTCSAKTGLACVAVDQFKVCLEGVPQGPAITCPAGSFCTPEERVCDSNATVAQSCAKCQQCDDSKIFACTKYNAFSLCTGGDSYNDTVEYICPEGLVCSVDSPFICVNESVTGIGGTCAWDNTQVQTTTPIITTTPNAKTDPNLFCSVQAFPGSYEVSVDNTCKEFIRCTSSGGSWFGNVYVCPRDTYFNATTQACGIGKPERCP